MSGFFTDKDTPVYTDEELAQRQKDLNAAKGQPQAPAVDVGYTSGNGFFTE